MPQPLPVDEVIGNLEGLNLNTTSDKEILYFISKFGKFGMMSLVCHPGYHFIRARLLSKVEKINKPEELSFKPRHLNNEYQRASTPSQTMFYGGLLQDDTPDTNPAIGRLTGLLEGARFMRDKESKGIWRIAYGNWVARQDVILASICAEPQLTEQNSKMASLREEYYKYLDEYPDLSEHSRRVLGYLSNKFANTDIRSQNDYKISALFTSVVLNKGLDGILYPSVRTGGEGINAAIRPESFESNKLNLIAAGTCIVLKNGGDTRMLNESVTILEGNETEFEMKLIDDPKKFKTDYDNSVRDLSLDEFQGSIDLYYLKS